MSRFTRSPRRWIVACLLCLGFWQFGQGAYIPAKAWMAQELMQRAWSRGREGAAQPVPWPWADTWPVARLRVPAMNRELYVLAGADGSSLAFGPGHLDGTALPGIGTSVVGGHRDTHFRFLEGLPAGTRINVQDGSGRWHVYRTGNPGILDVRRDELRIDPGANQLVLVTCYPFNALRAGGPLRYVVIAEAVEHRVPARTREKGA